MTSCFTCLANRIMTIFLSNVRINFQKLSENLKKNPELHGYGMKIVKDITEKYNGELITQIQDTTFSTLAILKTE